MKSRLHLAVVPYNWVVPTCSLCNARAKIKWDTSALTAAEKARVGTHACNYHRRMMIEEMK